MEPSTSRPRTAFPIVVDDSSSAFDSPTIRSRASSFTTSAASVGVRSTANQTLSRTSSWGRRDSSSSTTPTGTGLARASPAASSRSVLIRGGGSSRANAAASSQSITQTPPLLSNTSASNPGSTTAHNSSVAVPTLKALDSYNVRNVVAALDSTPDALRHLDDVWQSLCVRVLPLFNGEGIRGHVEDLNDLVISHIQRTFSRCTSSRTSSRTPSSDLSSLVTGLLIADLTDLLRIGTLTLASKLSPPNAPLPDDRFLARLDETWSFFWSGLLPNLEAIFWPLRCDDRLKAAVGGDNWDRVKEGRTQKAEGRIDIRKFALIAFRDEVVGPETNRLRRVLGQVPRGIDEEGGTIESPSSSRIKNPPHHRPAPHYSTTQTVPSGSSLTTITPRRRQLFSVLASVLTADDRQQSIENLLKSIRSNSVHHQQRIEEETSQHRPPFLNLSSSSTTNPPLRRGGFLGSVHSGHGGGGGGGSRPNTGNGDGGNETPFSDQTSEFFVDSPALAPTTLGGGLERPTTATMTGKDMNEEEEEEDGQGTITARNVGTGSRPGLLHLNASASSKDEFGASNKGVVGDEAGTTGGTIKGLAGVSRLSQQPQRQAR